MDLNEMLVFARVVRTGSFTTAAAELRMPKSTVSRKVSELEERLGSRLLQRTTRKLSLTDVGRTYYEYCARIAGEVEDAERAVTTLQAAPRGLLRVTAGINAAYLGPIVSDYLARYLEVRIELYCTGRTVDLVEEGFDIGIRAGALADSTLIARSVGRVSWFLVATPAYLKRGGRPKSPEDLKKHDCLFFGAGSTPFSLHLEGKETPVQVEVPARLLVSDFDVLYAVTVSGLGIGLLPAFRCVDDLRARNLIRVLGDWNAPSTPIHVVYPSTRHVSPKVKTFIEHFQAHLTPPPWELGPIPAHR
jgi:DNA-binding transcriptional LysR family regulator